MKANKILSTTLLAGALLMAMSCCKDGDDVIDDGIIPPTSAEFKQVFTDALNDIIQTKTFKAEDGIDFTSKKGVDFFVSPNSMFLDGNLVTGDVTFEFIELYKRGEMLVVNKPLMGTASNGSKGPMITGGQFYINISQNGKDIEANYHMTVPEENTGKINNGMTLWEGAARGDGDMVWNEVDISKEAGGIQRGANCYNVWGCLFKWINIDILFSLDGPKAQVWVKVPDGFDNKNCSVYVVYKDQPGALAFMDVWDTSKKMFTEHYGLAPIGMNFYVIFISTQAEGKYIYSYKDVTVEANKEITFEMSDLNFIDKDTLIALINNLK